MKKIAYMVLLSCLVYSCSNSSTTAETTESSTEVEETASEAAAEAAPFQVLNPNLASVDEMYSLGLLDEEIQSIIGGRPYLDPLIFLEKLKEVGGESKFDDLKSKLFLSMNLNTTAEEDFKMVPKVGDKMAHEFEEYRPYTSVEQFRREIGKYVSEEEVAAYENYVFVPVNLNTASKEEILAIPGVGDRMLHEFEEYRPYESIEQFRREIGKYVDENELARLERYVTL